MYFVPALVASLFTSPLSSRMAIAFLIVFGDNPVRCWMMLVLVSTSPRFTLKPRSHLSTVLADKSKSSQTNKTDGSW